MAWLNKIKSALAKRVKVGCRNFAYSTKRSKQTLKEQARRTKIFNDTRPHHGNDLIEALEFENFLRDDYGKNNIYS